MTIDEFKCLPPFQQEIVTLLTRIAKALESVAREDGDD